MDHANYGKDNSAPSITEELWIASSDDAGTAYSIEHQFGGRAEDVTIRDYWLADRNKA